MTICPVCNRKGGVFQRVTYDGAPEQGVEVHLGCKSKFFEMLVDQSWVDEMEAAFRANGGNYEGNNAGNNEGITVIDVFRALGVEPIPELTWAAGNIVREIYKSRNNGEPPEKRLHKKTNAGGSHCFATYPKSYRPIIEKVVQGLNTEKQRQGELF